MATCVKIADAVAAELNAAVDNDAFEMEFAAVRRLLPSYDLKDLADLQVTVVPRAVEITAASRATRQYDFQVDIGIQKKIGPDEDEDMPRLLALTEAIADYLAGRKLAAFSAAIWVKMQNEPLYDLQHLANDRVFTSLLSLTYRAMS